MAPFSVPYQGDGVSDPDPVCPERLDPDPDSVYPQRLDPDPF